jgi:hypothetical protein
MLEEYFFNEHFLINIYIILIILHNNIKLIVTVLNDNLVKNVT